MEFQAPNTTCFTVYSKSGCFFCKKIKQYLEHREQEYEVIDCDEYLIEDKPGFLKFIENLAGKPHTVFPIVFFMGKYVGGHDDSVRYIDKMNAFSDLYEC
jgi:glutaredoxin